MDIYGFLYPSQMTLGLARDITSTIPPLSLMFQRTAWGVQVAGCSGRVQAWLQEMAPHVKALAPRQLLTIGEEGFYGAASPLVAGNPTNWAQDVRSPRDMFVVPDNRGRRCVEE